MGSANAPQCTYFQLVENEGGKCMSSYRAQEEVRTLVKYRSVFVLGNKVAKGGIHMASLCRQCPRAVRAEDGVQQSPLSSLSCSTQWQIKALQDCFEGKSDKQRLSPSRVCYYIETAYCAQSGSFGCHCGPTINFLGMSAFVCVDICSPWTCCDHGDEKKASHPLEPELQTVVISHVDAGIPTRVPWKSSQFS